MRINKEIRSKILDCIVNLYDKQEGDIEEMKTRLSAIKAGIFEKAFDDLYGELTAKIKCVEKTFSVRKGNLTIKSESSGFYDEMYIEGKIYGKQSAVDVILPDTVFAEYFQLKTKIENLRDKIESYRSEVRVVLESVNTTEQLGKIWPEILDYIPPEILTPRSAIKLPALRIESISSKLKLDAKD